MYMQCMYMYLYKVYMCCIHTQSTCTYTALNTHSVHVNTCTQCYTHTEYMYIHSVEHTQCTCT